MAISFHRFAWFNDQLEKVYQTLERVFHQVSKHLKVNKNIGLCLVFISLIRMRSKRDIKMGRLCTPGDAVLGIVGGGVTFRFLNGEAILDENMLFWVRLYALVVVLKILLDFRL